MSILPIFIPHLGCPHQCVFCDQRTISGQQEATVAAASAQIGLWRQRLRADVQHEAAFYGGSFTALPLALQKQLLQLTDALLAEDYISSVRVSTRPDYIDAERLELLKQHRVRLVELGVQSLDDAVLQAAGRGHSAQQSLQACRLLQAYGFSTGIQLMLGLPLQSFASLQATVEQVLQLKPDIARIYPVLVIKNTPLAKLYEAGQYTPLTLEQAVEQAAWAYSRLTAAGINVIRVGLQADSELCSPGNIIAGPFHPALGEMVQGHVLRDRLTPMLAAQAEGGAQELWLTCPRRLESKLRGQKNANLRYWQQLWPQLRLHISPTEQEEVSLCLSAVPSRR